MIIELNLTTALSDGNQYIDVTGYDSCSLEFTMLLGSFAGGTVTIQKTNSVGSTMTAIQSVTAAGLVELSARDWEKARYIVLQCTTAATSAARVMIDVALKKNEGSLIDPVQVDDPALVIPMGEVSGLSSINKFGRNSSVASAGTEEIWDGSVAYTWPTTASVTHVKAAVDSATTQGMAIEVQGLDTNWLAVTQTATLDAGDSTTEVLLDPALRRVFRMRVLDAAVADQNVLAGPTGFANQQAIILAGNNQTLQAMFTTSATQNAYLTGWYATVNAVTNQDPSSMTLRLWARDNLNGYAPQLKHIEGLVTGSEHHRYNPYVKFGPRTDIWITASPLDKIVDVSAGFDLILHST